MEFSENRAIYMQLADIICRAILQGQYKVEDRIPSVRELSTQAVVNTNTVVRAYEWMQQKGIVHTRRGMGYYVTPEAAGIIQTIRRKEFLEEQLPQLFVEMTALGIGIDEVGEEWKKFNNNKNA